MTLRDFASCMYYEHVGVCTYTHLGLPIGTYCALEAQQEIFRISGVVHGRDRQQCWTRSLTIDRSSVSKMISLYSHFFFISRTSPCPPMPWAG
jgi:hypothetical protein